MGDMFRTFAVRNPVALTDAQTATIGIHSHPERYRSARFGQWQGLCVANDVPGLQAAAQAFVAGPQAVKALDDLAGWGGIFKALQWHGARIEKATAIGILNDSRAASLFDKRGHILGDAWTNVADTILALACLGRLSERRGVDVQAVLRVMSFVERAVALKLDLPERRVAPHFSKPILLPHQFFALDPCRDLNPSGVKAGEGRDRSPAKDPCNCEPTVTCVDQSPCCATITPYVVDLMVVREHTRCFRPGDLSFIRNVMIGETLNNRHRRLDRAETTSETDTETTKFSERDLQVEDRTSLKSEIQDTVRSDMNLDAGVTGNASWGNEKVGAKYDVHMHADVSSSNSKETIRKEARDYARDVVDRSVTRLEEKVKTSLRTTRLVETEDVNEHGFINTTGENVCGQYLHVDKVSRAQVYNYGKKAVVDINLPEPAELYIRLLESEFPGIEPPQPATIDVTAQQITPDNYAALTAAWGVTDAPAPPAFTKPVQVTMEGEPGDPKGDAKSGSHTFTFGCAIPDDYAGVSMAVNSIRLNYNTGGGVSISASLGNASVWHQQGGSQSLASTLPSIEGSQTLIVHTWDVTNFTWVLTVTCELKASAKLVWQAAVLAALEKARDKKVADYQKFLDDKAGFLAEEAERQRQRFNQNPFLLREIERAELKRMAISYVSCQFYDQFDAMKYRVKPCGHAQMDIREAELEGRFVQFFEQAFNWNLMTYIFRGYYWGRKHTWREKLLQESDDPIFRQFLAAGSARVLVPIRDGYLDHIEYFLATGEIWGNSGKPPLPDDPHYVSLAQELKEQKDNYHVDRRGRVDVVQGAAQVRLHDTEDYWNLGDPPAGVAAHLDQLAIDADIDREIVIDAKVYRIVAIDKNPAGAVLPPIDWTITLDRPYEGDSAANLPWSTGALFVGAPWEFVTPTSLTFLREKSQCLPCYPLKECKEGE